jgi:HEAT repeat protein
MRRYLSAAIFTIFTLSSSAHAFDWAGRLQRDLKQLSSASSSKRRHAVYQLGRYRKEQVKAHVLKAMHDLAPSVQRAAAEVAGELRIVEAIPILMRWLTHWDDQLRISAARVLGNLGGPLATRTLIRALVDPESKVRLQVVRSLGKSASALAVVPLIGRLEDSSSDVRQATIEVLGKIKAKRAVIPLMGRLSDPSRSVRRSAIIALGKIGNKHAAAAIARKLQDHAPNVVLAAIETVGKLRYAGAAAPLIERYETVYKHRDKTAEALAHIGTDIAIRALVRALRDSSLRRSAQLALSKATKQNPRHINALLRDPRTPVQVAMVAVQIARDAKVKGAVPLLIEQLRLGRLPQSTLAEALGKIGDKGALRPLLSLLDAKSHSTRLAAMRAIGPLLDSRAAEPLLKSLVKSDPIMRRYAVSYLGRLKSRLATTQLSVLARGENTALARLATLSLTKISDPRAAPTYVKLLAHPDETLRRLAITGLARLPLTNQGRNQVAIDLLGRCKRALGLSRVRYLQAIAVTLRGRDNAAAASLAIRLLSVHDPRVRLAAADVLGAMRSSTISQTLPGQIAALPAAIKHRAIAALAGQPATDQLLKSLLTFLSDKNDAIAAAAGYAIGQIGSSTTNRSTYQLIHEQAAQGLVQLIHRKGWASRINATAAVAKLRARIATPSLLSLLRDSNPYVRANAALACGRLGIRQAAATLTILLEKDRTPWVRRNALLALERLAPNEVILRDGKRFTSMKKLREHVRSRDHDERLRALLDKKRKTARRNNHRFLTLHLFDDNDKALRNQRFVVVPETGWIRASLSDSRGQAWVERLPPGRYFIELPPPPVMQTE